MAGGQAAEVSLRTFIATGLCMGQEILGSFLDKQDEADDHVGSCWHVRGGRLHLPARARSRAAGQSNQP